MRTLQISEKTYQKIKKQLESEEKIPLKDISGMIGQKWFFRTVTYHIVGKVTAQLFAPGVILLVLENASWVADSGRFMQAIKNGTLNEVEPVGDWYINLNTVTDFSIWNHELPKDQK